MLTPEQKTEKQKLAREAWLAKHPEYYKTRLVKHPDYFKEGGKGYQAQKKWKAMNPG